MADPRTPTTEPQRDALEAETRDAIRRIHYYGYPPDERLAADVEADVEEIVAPLFALLARVTGERDAAVKRLEWLDDERNWCRVRPGRNMIGVSNGGWLLTHGRIGEGPESKHFDLGGAIDAALSEAPHA